MRNLLLLAPLALAACATTQPYPPGPGGICRGDNLGQFAGRPYTAELGEQIRRESGARVLRRVDYGMVVTMEFSAQRVTVWLTQDNQVDRATCG